MDKPEIKHGDTSESLGMKRARSPRPRPMESTTFRSCGRHTPPTQVKEMWGEEREHARLPFFSVKLCGNLWKSSILSECHLIYIYIYLGDKKTNNPF